EKFFFLLRFLIEAGFGGADARFGLAFPFLLADAQSRRPLILQFGFAGFGADGRLLFALLKFGLESQLLLRQFLFQAGLCVAGLSFEHALQVGFAAAEFLFGLCLGFGEASLGLRLQLLLATFKLGLTGFFALLDFLLPAGFELAGA